MDEWNGAFDGDAPFPDPPASSVEVIFPTPKDIRARKQQILSTVVSAIVVVLFVCFSPYSSLIKFLFAVWTLVVVIPTSIYSLTVGRIEIIDSRVFVSGFPTIFHRIKIVEYEVSKSEILSMEFKRNLSGLFYIALVPRIEIMLSGGRNVYIRLPLGFFGFFRKNDDLQARLKPFNGGYKSI